MLLPLHRQIANLLAFTLILSGSVASAQFMVNFNVPDGEANWNDESSWADEFIPLVAADEIARVASGGTALVTTSVPDVVGLEIGAGGVDIRSGGSLQVVPGMGGNRGVSEIGGAGSLSIASGGSFTSLGLAARGRLSLAAGGNLTTTKTLALQGTFHVEQIDNGYQPVSVAGTANVGGTLELTFPSSPSVSAGDTWNLIDVAAAGGTGLPDADLQLEFLLASRLT